MSRELYRWIRLSCFVLATLSLPAVQLHGQNRGTSRVSASLSNTAHPGTVKAVLRNGGITVKGYEGKEVVAEATFRNAASSAHESGPPKINSSKVGTQETPDLKVQEDNNIVTIDVSRSDRPVDLIIQVPFRSSLGLGCTTNGGIVVENVTGEIEVSNQNGPVQLTKVAGVVVADARNGKLSVQLVQVTPNKPMSFSVVNGDIEVTLPADIKAKFKLNTVNGRAEGDFGISPASQTSSDGGRQASAPRISLSNGGNQMTLSHRAISVNGGGPDLSFNSVNGNVLIRKLTR